MQFWDYRQPRKYLNILSCQVPVWKARYTVSVALRSTAGMGLVFVLLWWDKKDEASGSER